MKVFELRRWALRGGDCFLVYACTSYQSLIVSYDSDGRLISTCGRSHTPAMASAFTDNGFGPVTMYVVLD